MNKSMSDIYQDTELTFPGEKVADKLCIDGACYNLFPEELTNTEADRGCKFNNQDVENL